MYHTTMVWALISLALAGAAWRSDAQAVVRFDSTWRYNEGGTNLGTGWRTNTFNDNGWPSGQSLFAAETTAYPEPFRTTMKAPDMGGPITTYYRTHFNFSGNPANVGFLATNYVDDGMVVWLNNTEVFRFNMPATGIPIFTTLATANNAEPQIHITNVVAAGLSNGDNVLAVEVHQQAATSSDVVFGMSVTLIPLVPIAITSQPQSQTVAVGTPVMFSVGVTGSNPRFQWYRNGVAIGGATATSYSIASATTNAAGNYTVVVTNSLNSVTSSVAVLTVGADITGPQLLSAVVQDTGSNNLITVGFDERLLPVTATNVANYKLTRCDGAAVTISNQILYVASSSNVQIRVGGANWVVGGDYILTVNGVADLKTNYVSVTNNQIGVSFFETRVPFDQNWTYYYDSFLSGLYPAANWPSNNYVEPPEWGAGQAAFSYGTLPACDVNTTIGQGPITYYYRTHFSASNSGRADLQLRTLCSAGQVYYLNGIEFFRVGMPTGAINPNTPGTVQGLNCAALPAPRMFTVNNLRSGDNVLAVEAHQPNMTTITFYFAAELKVGSPTEVSRTRINYALTNNTLRLSWTGPHVLQTATEVLGPWSVAGTNLTGFTNPVTGPRKFFRLREKCN
jgi:hypothetical protein